MMMFDKYGYINELRNQHPAEKCMFSMTCLLATIIMKDPILSCFIFMLMTVLITVKAKVPALYYVKALLLPVFFLLTSLIVIACEVAFVPLNAPSVFQVHFFSFYLAVTYSRIELCKQLFFMSISAVASLYFLILTTPVNDWIDVLRKWNVPSLLLELMLFMYRFIFVLLELTTTIYHAQQSRLGYSTIKGGYRSLAELIVSLFTKSLHYSHQLMVAMESRGYDGNVRFVNQMYPVSIKFWLGYITTILSFVLISMR